MSYARMSDRHARSLLRRVRTARMSKPNSRAVPPFTIAEPVMLLSEVIFFLPVIAGALLTLPCKTAAIAFSDRDHADPTTRTPLYLYQLVAVVVYPNSLLNLFVM